MARTSSIITILTFFDPCDLDLQPTLNVSNDTSPSRGQQLCKIILKSMHKCTSYGRTSSIHVYDHFDLYSTPVILTFNFSIKFFQMALLLLKGNNCAKLFLNSCIIIQVMVLTNPDGRTHGRTYARMHAHTPTKNCNNSLTRKRAQQKFR